MHGGAGFKERRRPFTDCKEGLTSLVSMLISSAVFNIQIRSVQALQSGRVQGWVAVCLAALSILCMNYINAQTSCGLRLRSLFLSFRETHRHRATHMQARTLRHAITHTQYGHRSLWMLKKCKIRCPSHLQLASYPFLWVSKGHFCKTHFSCAGNLECIGESKIRKQHDR